MKNLNLKAIALSFVTVFSSVSGITLATMQSANATGGVPTFDWKADIDRYQHFKKLEEQVKALKSGGDFTGLLKNPLIEKEVNKYLPSKYKSVYEAILAKDSKTLQNMAKKLAMEEAYKRTNPNSLARAIVAQADYVIANEASLKVLEKNLKDIEAIGRNMNRAVTLAEKQDYANVLQQKAMMMNIQFQQIQLGLERARDEQDKSRRLYGAMMLENQQKASKAHFKSLFW